MDPRSIDEPVELVDYDPNWPAHFATEMGQFREALGDRAVLVEHFGSTAVPGLPGKPVVDLLVGVRDIETVRGCVPALEALGYENFGEVFIPGRLYLRRRSSGHFNIALTPHGSPFWDAQLLVRDYLRAHPAEVAAYAESKRAAFAAGNDLFSTYSQAKAPFLAGLIERAKRGRGG